MTSTPHTTSRKRFAVVREERPSLGLAALDFFAGSGLVTAALKPQFEVVWANDIDPKKARIFAVNHPHITFVQQDISEIDGATLPAAALSWGSFPCQDLSLAGKIKGLDSDRSGLVWEWIRVMDEMRVRPPLVVAENVNGLISAKQGAYYIQLHDALTQRGYRVGAVVLDAERWVPQSRVRVFVVGVQKDLELPKGVLGDGPCWLHTTILRGLAKDVKHWTWWKMPEPTERKVTLEDIVDFDAEFHNSDLSKYNISLVPERHLEKLKNGVKVAPGYKRVREGHQVLELRFDGIAGCLRTACGGSSRQYLVIKTKSGLRTRLLTINEAAKLMGAPANYKLPGTYNEAYHALGDAVAVPAVKYLSRHLLIPILKGQE